MTRNTLILLAAIAMFAAPAVGAESPAILLEKGVFAEETKGDIDAAIKIYKQITDDADANRKYVAQAHYRLGACLIKQKKYSEATPVLREFVASYPNQTKLVAKAQKHIRRARSRISGPELSKIVTQAVTTVSTCAETDPRITVALESLVGLNEQAVVKELTTHFDAEKSTIRRSAVYILWKGQFENITAAEAGLVKLCKHEKGMTRGMAAITLGARKTPSSLQLICDMALKDSSPYARRCAAYALGLMGDPKARSVLEKALKDSNEFVASNAENALAMLNAQSRLPAAVIAYMTDIHLADYKKLQSKGMRVNSHIYGVDNQFNRHFGGLMALKNKTDKIVRGEIQAGTFSYTDIELMNETGALQKVRFVDRKTSSGGRYRLMWTLDKPLKPGDVRLLGWKKKATTKLVKTDDGFKLKMHNHFGSPVLENFFLVVPPDVEIVTQSTEYASRKRVGAFDVYRWSREVPRGTTNKVELVLKSSGQAAADLTPDQRAARQLAKRARYLWSQRKLEESEKLFKEAVAKDPKNPDAWNGLGWALQNQDKKEAADAFGKCLALDPKNAGALNGLGWIAKQAGKEDEALVWWQKAVVANPQTTAALRGMIDTLMARGQYHHAAVCYAAWLRVDPNNEKIKTEFEAVQTKAAAARAESKIALAAAEKWLEALDADKYGQTWDLSAELFRKGISKEKWTAKIDTLMGPMGKFKSRKRTDADYRTSLPGSPVGQYVVFTFKTVYAKKPAAIETVTSMKDKDGKWRVSGYYIK
jgi:tetratricopeptide (TPR) repeat protein